MIRKFYRVGVAMRESKRPRILAAIPDVGGRGIWSRLALALQRDPLADYQNLLEDVHRRWETPIRPIQVSGGPG